MSQQWSAYRVEVISARCTSARSSRIWGQETHVLAHNRMTTGYRATPYSLWHMCAKFAHPTHTEIYAG
jgi:hypothetical protein